MLSQFLQIWIAHCEGLRTSALLHIIRHAAMCRTVSSIQALLPSQPGCCCRDFGSVTGCMGRAYTLMQKVTSGLDNSSMVVGLV